MDSITSTADAKDCPGVCVHTLATIICYEVLDEIPCPSANMKCCVESSSSLNGTTTTMAPPTTTTTQRATTTRMRTTTTAKPTMIPTQKLDKDPGKDEKTDGIYSFY